VSFKGTVKNGVVVLPPEVSLPDGTEVEVIADQQWLLGSSRQTSPGFRDYRAFLNSYAPEDEGLYDDAKGR
jgi:hypothetical protein